MKILYFIDSLETTYPRDQNYIIGYTSEGGYEVEVITSKDLRFEIYDSIFFPHAKVLRCPLIFRVKGAKVYVHPKMICKMYKVCDVVHSFTFFTFSSVKASFIKSDVKVLRSEIGPPGGLNFVKAKRGIYSYLIKIYKKSYNYFTVYNELERQSLELLGIPRDKAIVLPPMLDTAKFAKLRKKRENYDNFISIGTIGRISPEKGMHQLVPIYEHIEKHVESNQYKFRVVLAGRPDYEDYADRLLRYLKMILGRNFVYMGEVAPPYRFYEKVDVVIIPSITETGAISVLEAMAAGKCVIGSNIYPVNLYITHGYNGFLFNSPKEASKIVGDILNQTINIESISRRAQEYARRHDFRLVCKILEKIYKG